MFVEHDLIICLWDFLAAGSDTTSQTIRWILYYLAKHQNIQAKMRQEIDSVIPKDRSPTLDDKIR